MNIMMLLEMTTSAMPERLVAGPVAARLTHGRLLEAAQHLAARLRSSGAQHMVVCCEPDSALPVALFGSAWAGVPYVPVNYRLPDADLRKLVARVTPALALVDESTETRLTTLDGLTMLRSSDLLASQESSSTVSTSGDLPEVADWPNDGDAAAVLLYTSGTTGAPKSAVLRHKHLASYVFGTVDFASAGTDESHLMAVPPYHVASVAAQLSQVFSGRRIVMMPKFDADDWIDLAQAESVTHAMLVPTMLARITDALKRRGETLPGVRAIAYGGGKSHLGVVERALELFPEAGFAHAYGLTETSSTVCLLSPEEHRQALASDDPKVRSRLSSVGRPLPTVEVSVRDTDGSEVPTGVAGEIWVRGEHVSGEYLESGSQLDSDGWFHTRDGGRIDGDGYVWLLGRNDDLIIRGGENMSPGEIEDVVIAHPGVADVAAFGVPSIEWGEEVALAVVTRQPAPEASELRDLVTSRLRSSRTPRDIYFVDELPYNDTGKLLRRVLRDRFANADSSTRG